MKKKNTDDLRIEKIVQMLVDEPMYLGGRKATELPAVAAKKFKIGKKEAEKLVAQAREEFKEITRHNVEEHLARAIMQREELISRARKEENLRVELAAMKERDMLLGIWNGNIRKKKNDDEKRFESLEDVVRYVFGVVFTTPLSVPTALAEEPPATADLR